MQAVGEGVLIITLNAKSLGELRQLALLHGNCHTQRPGGRAALLRPRRLSSGGLQFVSCTCDKHGPEDQSLRRLCASSSGITEPEAWVWRPLHLQSPGLTRRQFLNSWLMADTRAALWGLFPRTSQSS